MKKSVFKNAWLGLFLVVCQLSFGQEIKSWQNLTATSYLYERTDFEIQLAASFSNPYDADDITLDLVFTSPSSEELVLPCFFVNGDQNNSV